MSIKEIVEELIGKHNSNNPFVIANNLNVIIIYSNMRNTLGFYNNYKRSKFIHINNNAPEKLKMFICSHELGHVIQHPDFNTPFLKRHTLFSTDRIELEANTFAVELMLPDKLLQKYSDYSVFNIGKKLGIPDKLINLKTK